MNEILNGHGLGDFDWSGLVNALVKTGGDIATTAITAKNSGQSTGGNYDFNNHNNSNTNTNGGGTVIPQQQDKTLLYIGVGALALMAIFMITNSRRK